MSICELHKFELKGLRFLYTNAALVAWKDVCRRLIEVQTKQQQSKFVTTAPKCFVLMRGTNSVLFSQKNNYLLGII
jgi:hypothetical protein